ncbi:MAG: hypothetical protein KBH82_03715 [Syntrophorhabdaceae bacterium]|nr:hypothetical protein [Syntrophorhabdaceae bacterium]
MIIDSMGWCWPSAVHGRETTARITCSCLSRERSGLGSVACGLMLQA